MTIYVSIVSHGHKDIIEQINCLSTFTSNNLIEVFLLDNIGENGLKNYCEINNINYLENKCQKGFGENNNLIFSHIETHIKFKEHDCFLILNPDVNIDVTSILKVYELSIKNENQLTTINLYKDSGFKDFDYCVRNFPSFIDFVSSYLGLGNKTIIDKSLVSKAVNVDWAAGSFLLFKASLYHKLGGFDPKYFMYCEDIDICWRANKLYEVPLVFYPEIKARHFAQHANRSLFSKHFLWHLRSMLRYLTLYYGLRNPYKFKE